MFRAPLLLAMLLSILPGQAIAWPAGTTDEERALLPSWCAHVQGGWGGRDDIYKAMIAKYGFAWSHMHHFCYGLVNYGRLQGMRVPQQHRGNVYGMAKQDMLYSIQRAEKTFAFRPGMLATLTRMHILAGAMQDAKATATTLTEDYPELADGYTLLADVLFRQDRRADALEVLRKGEEMSSDKERFQRLRSILPLK